jgi:hypothetical protein
MKIYKSIVIILVMLSFFIGCDNVEDSNIVEGNQNNPGSNDWLIPSNEVFDGGPGKDGIPALTDPNFISVGSVDYLQNDDLVIIVKEGDGVKIYPHPILDWHEIINDKLGNKTFALTYCPLTGSGISWNRIIDGVETTFGVSGLLYNTNLIAYDRKTESNWSQMKLQSVNGPLISSEITTFPIIETNWQTAKNMYENALVVSTNTGYSRSYGRYPYGEYRTNHSSLIFPVNNNDSRLNGKERVLGIFGSNFRKAYRILDFNKPKVFVDQIGNEKYIIYGDNKNNLISAFLIDETFAENTFTKSSLSLPFIIEDNTGNHYDIFGKSKEASKPNLQQVKSFIAYWFAWAAFYPETDLHKE